MYKHFIVYSYFPNGSNEIQIHAKLFINFIMIINYTNLTHSVWVKFNESIECTIIVRKSEKYDDPMMDMSYEETY
jgi:hypothetical protein